MPFWLKLQHWFPRRIHCAPLVLVVAMVKAAPKKGRPATIDHGIIKVGKTGLYAKSWDLARKKLKDMASPGPRNLAEKFDWPSSVARGICDSGYEEADSNMVYRLSENLQTHGLTLDSDYSGMECVRAALDNGIAGLKKVALPHLEHKVSHTRCCDVEATQLNVLTRLSKEKHDSKTCVMNDIFSRLPQVARDYIHAALPHASLSKEKKKEAMTAIDDWIKRNRAWLYPRSATSACLVHGGNCPVRMHRFAKYMASGPELDSIPKLGESQAHVDQMLKEIKIGEDRPILVNSAGVTCVAWC